MKIIINTIILSILLIPTVFLSLPNIANADLFGGQIVTCDGPVEGFDPKTDDETNSTGRGIECTWEELMETLGNVLITLIQIAIVISIIIIAYAGFMYLTAGGETGKISKAHSLLTKAAIGLLLALAAWLIIELLINTLGVDEDFSFTGF